MRLCDCVSICNISRLTDFIQGNDKVLLHNFFWLEILCRRTWATENKICSPTASLSQENLVIDHKIKRLILRNSPNNCCLGYSDSVQTKLRLALFRPETYSCYCTQLDTGKKVSFLFYSYLFPLLLSFRF